MQNIVYFTQKNSLQCKNCKIMQSLGHRRLTGHYSAKLTFDDRNFVQTEQLIFF